MEMIWGEVMCIRRDFIIEVHTRGENERLY